MNATIKKNGVARKSYGALKRIDKDRISIEEGAMVNVLIHGKTECLVELSCGSHVFVATSLLMFHN